MWVGNDVTARSGEQETRAETIHRPCIHTRRRSAVVTLLSECGAIKRGVSSFPPQYEATYYIEDWCDIGDKNICDYIELEISYKRMDGKVLTHNYTLPLNELIDQNYSNPPDTFMGEIPFYLKEINQTLKKFEK